MPTIFQEKEQSATETPILLFDCVLSNGQIERWSTHKVVVSGATYQPRVLLHNLFQMQTSSDMGVDAIPKISVTLANADSHFSELERSVGWKGSSVTVTFLFFKLKDGIPETETMVLFKGIANPPDEIREATFRLTAVNRMSMQRVMLPPVRVERPREPGTACSVRTGPRGAPRRWSAGSCRARPGPGRARGPLGADRRRPGC